MEVHLYRKDGIIYASVCETIGFCIYEGEYIFVYEVLYTTVGTADDLHD